MRLVRRLSVPRPPSSSSSGPWAMMIISDFYNFDALLNDLRLMPPEYREKAKKEESKNGDSGRARIVADYIAGMTDRYAIKEYKRIFDPTELT